MSNHPTPKPGDVIAFRYQLLEEVGRGGFGVIYRARQNAEPQEVALKILIPPSSAFDDNELEQRFQREALMAEHLIHPHAVRQYDFGRTDAGLRYIAMEFLRGHTLSERLAKTGPLDAPLIARMARGVLEVLELAHSKDIVHRDLKPDNIMLCEVGNEHNFPKVLDFGAAKTTEGEHDITSAGMTLGSPAYMAPEVLTGLAPGAASDLYALGLTLCECILGHRLVQGKTALDRARVQLSPDPLTVPPAVTNHPLYPLINSAIQKNVKNRFSSATAMLNALKHLDLEIQVSERTIPMEAISARIPQEQAEPEHTMLLDDGAFDLPGTAGDDAAPVDATEMLDVPPDIEEMRRKNREKAGFAAASSEPAFDEDATEFLQNPLADKTMESSLATDVTDPLKKVVVGDQAPAFQEDPTEFLQNPLENPDASTSDFAAPPLDFGVESIEINQEPEPAQPASTGEQRKPILTASAALKAVETAETDLQYERFGEKIKGPRAIYNEPSEHTDFMTIKTTDGRKERLLLPALGVGLIAFILLFIIAYSIAPT